MKTTRVLYHEYSFVKFDMTPPANRLELDDVDAARLPPGIELCTPDDVERMEDLFSILDSFNGEEIFCIEQCEADACDGYVMIEEPRPGDWVPILYKHSNMILQNINADNDSHRFAFIGDEETGILFHVLAQRTIEELLDELNYNHNKYKPLTECDCESTGGRACDACIEMYNKLDDTYDEYGGQYLMGYDYANPIRMIAANQHIKLEVL